jgi:hypothetical protein
MGREFHKPNVSDNDLGTWAMATQNLISWSASGSLSAWCDLRQGSAACILPSPWDFHATCFSVLDSGISLLWCLGGFYSTTMRRRCSPAPAIFIFQVVEYLGPRIVRRYQCVFTPAPVKLVSRYVFFWYVWDFFSTMKTAATESSMCLRGPQHFYSTSRTPMSCMQYECMVLSSWGTS